MNAPEWNRFAHWPRWPARLALALLLAMLALAALTPMRSGEGVHTSVLDGKTIAAGEKTRDDDLALYDRVIERLRRGENYYEAVAIEHRASRYPLQPGFAVRLPTLAWIEAQLPPPAKVNEGGKVEALIALLLVAAVLIVWWRRLGEDPGAEHLRIWAMVLLFLGVQIGTTGYFFVLHELWAGSLIALSMGLYRPEKDKWIGAWIAAAAALAIREHALPFVLLLGAFALWHRRWRELAAWALLVALFLAGMAWHLHVVAGLVRPDDAMGPSWMTLRGLSGWMSMVVLSSNLRLLPAVIAGPLMVLMVFGWTGWRTRIGTFATLLFLGYGLAFMIAGRADNWYWGMTIQATMWVGLAFVPMALAGLVRAAFPSASSAASAGTA
ncbi:hypothetical protein [Novosphingobium sp. TH158]|uniref:hypothetical protein n=1 Tax=Novosphingobium sp. TH158 TaxID=2067455 RepID=UPI000C7A91D3|nr:hypothetical protein [Novosphingobium sp. TH158]PLK26463.1 hypothetical protein C0V78_05870 [Novosphingobium sp. TH158]